jgi:predicted Zn-dependent peptidase
LDQLRDLLLAELDKIKKGEFSEDLLPAVITDMKLQETKSYESNRGRANAFVDAAIHGLEWKDCVNRNDRLSKITKQDVIDFANRNYRENYVIVYKRTGEDKNVKKVDKPAITPVEVNREAKSPFVQTIIDGKTPDIQPVFIDYNKDIKHLKLTNGITINYKVNTENNLFDLYYLVNMGKDNDRKIEIALNYLQYLGTTKYTPAAIQQEFYKLGCSFSVNSSDDQIWVSLSGLSDNFAPAVKLFESLLTDAQPNPEAYSSLVKDIIKARADAKLDKSTILWSAMYNYGIYGPMSSFTNILNEDQLNAIKPEELITIIKNVTSYPHHILYYGPADTTALLATLNKYHNVPAQLKLIPPAIKYVQLSTDSNRIYVINYDMKQAEIIMLSKEEQYNKQIIPTLTAYNEYFGGGMSSIVFQDMRESKALAYSVFSNFQTPQRKEKAHYNMAYIGTQADKLPEAMAGMKALLTNMPESPTNFNTSKDAVIKKIQTERITKSGVLFSYERAQKLGLDYDIRQDIYKKVPSMSFNDIKNFQSKYIKGDKYTIMVLGDKNKLDIPTLEKYGKVTFLNLNDVFGY